MLEERGGKGKEGGANYEFNWHMIEKLIIKVKESLNMYQFCKNIQLK
jgi:hypothetical protein